MVPRPAAPRIAHIRVPEAVDVGAKLGAAGELSEAQADELVDRLKARMQAALDGINEMVHATPRTKNAANPLYR